MKITIYSTLAAVVAVLIGQAAKPATYTGPGLIYKYIGPYPVNSATLITNVNNWTFVAGPPSTACLAKVQACEVQTTITTTWPFHARPSQKFPVIQTIGGLHPRFTVSDDWTQGILEVYSKPNQLGD